MDNTFDDGKSSTFGKQLMTYVMSKLPYSGLDVSDMTDEVNPKYKYFENVGERRAEVLARHSVTQNQEYNSQNVGHITADKRYSQVMYANIPKDKVARIKDYRMMAAFSEVAKALDEICDEIINVDTNNNACTELKILNADLSEFQYETLQKEYKRYISYFDFEHKGWAYFRQLLVEGEIFWEHIIHEEYKEEGILGVVQVPSELIDPVFSNIQNIMIKGYLYRKPIFDPKNPMKQIKTEFIPMDKNQITYIHSDVWNEAKTMRLPFLENARRAYRQLSMIEDSIVIYRLARAPERLVFNVDVGNMPPPKAEAYLRKLMTQYWSSKTYDPAQGGIVQKFNPQSILDNFWFAKRAGSEGTNVSQLGGGQNLGQLDDLMYFVKKLYQSLNVPTTRLDPQDAFRDGADMLREELKFAKFIVRLQQNFAAGIKNGFITHLQLKGLMREFDLKERNFEVSFYPPTNFYEVRQQQKIELKTSVFGNIAGNPSVSPTYAQKKYLGWSDLDIKANREFLRKDKAFDWELQQIQNMGPDWKNIVKAQDEAAGGSASTEIGGGGILGGGGGGGGMPPPFAGGPATPEGASAGATPEAGATPSPAPEAAPAAIPVPPPS